MASVPNARGQPLTPNNADSLISYSVQYKVLICTEHRYALPNLDRHLYDYHRGAAAMRRQLVSFYSDPTCFPVLEPHQLRLPAPLGPPIPALAAPVEALHCDEDDCDFVTPSRSWMRKHCNTAHLWHPPCPQATHWNRVWAQTFFTAGKQKYFTVLPSLPVAPRDGPGYGGSAVTTEALSVRDAELALIRDHWAGRVEEHRQDLNVVDAEVAKQDRTGWFNRTGWPQHLKGANLKHLAGASNLPAQNEHILATAVTLTDLLIERSVAGLSTLHLETRRWLKSPRAQEPDPRPLARLQNRESQSKYARYLKRFVCYSLRVAMRVAIASDGRSEEVNLGAASEERVGEGESEDESSDDESSDDESSIDDAATRHAQQPDRLADAVRLFPWRGNQLALARRLLDAIQMAWPEAEQVQALLAYCMAFVQHKVWTDPFESGLLHFLAVLSIDPESGRLREAHDFSYLLAGMVYDVRAITAEALLPAAERASQSEAATKRFLAERLDYLVDGSYGPMSHMVSLLAYSKHLAMNRGNAGMIDWPSEELMTLRGERIYMTKFRDTVHGVLARAEAILWQQLMWCSAEERFEVDLDGVEDDVTFTRRGYSFVDKPTNALGRGLEWMLARMLRTGAGRQLRQEKAMAWRKQRVRQYLRTVDEFKQLLLFLVHVAGGQPARGPEVTSLRFKNGFLQDRNVFVISGQITTVTRYHKSQWQWDTPKVIPRFLPWRVGQLMTVCISHLQPFAEMLSVTVLGRGWTDHLWADAAGPWETDKLTAIIARETAKGLGVRLTTLSYRHAAAAIGRRKIGAAFARGYREEVGEEEEADDGATDGEEAAIELAAGRTTKIGEGTYGVSSSVVKHLSVRSMETFRPLCNAWHEFLGLASYRPGSRSGGMERGGSKARRARSRSYGGGGSEDDGDCQSDLRPEKRMRPCNVSATGLLTPETRSSRSPVSSRTQSVVAAASDLADLRSARNAPPDGDEGDKPAAGGQERIQQAMCKALGTEVVGFRSEEQAEAMRAVIRLETPLVVVLPTGGGKSLLFMTAACLGLEAGMTIVVVPFRQLIRTLVGKAHERGIECEEWQPAMTDPVRLLVVSADKVSSWRFLDFAARMKAKRILRRVFVDECHLAFTAHVWRPKLAELKRVRCLGVPTTFLTATLPPVQEFEFEESMGLDYARYIRAPTARAKTRYYVHTCIAGSLMATAVETCKRRMRHLRPGQKAVAYCRSRGQAEELATHLACGFVHAKADDNEATVDAWLAEGGFVTATSALGTGVDFNGIVFVLHVGMPYGLIDFGQESGRAGRAGEEVASVILIEEGMTAGRGRQDRMQSVDVEAMAEYVTTQGCRRRVLSRYFDGRDEDCGAGSMARCDRCGEGEVDIQRSERVLAEDRSVVERVLDALADGCVACWLRSIQHRQELPHDRDHYHAVGHGKAEHAGGDAAEWQHWRQDCERAAELEGEWDKFREGLSLDLGTHSCFKCGFSQKMCRTGVDGGEKCQWPGVVSGVLIAATEAPMGRGIIRRAGYKGDFDEGLSKYRRWARGTHRARVWGEVMSNAMAVVLEFILWSESLRG